MKVQFVSVSSYSKICRSYQQNYTILSSKIFNILGEDFSVSKYNVIIFNSLKLLTEDYTQKT